MWPAPCPGWPLGAPPPDVADVGGNTHTHMLPPSHALQIHRHRHRHKLQQFANTWRVRADPTPAVGDVSIKPHSCSSARHTPLFSCTRCSGYTASLPYRANTVPGGVSTDVNTLLNNIAVNGRWEEADAARPSRSAESASSAKTCSNSHAQHSLNCACEIWHYLQLGSHHSTGVWVCHHW